MKNKVELILSGNVSGLQSALGTGERGMRRFGSTARHEFDRIRNAARSLEGTLVSLGVGYGASQMILQSARLDKSLVQIKQTAGGTAKEVKGLRADLFRLGRDSGQDVELLKDGFNVLVQSGQSMSEGRETLKGINTAMAVTGSNAQTLASGLTVAAKAFSFDLSQPGLALELLDKMTVAGRLGNAELEDLSGIFARLGVNAASAGMKFDTTLAFVEGLSIIERQPERLANLADSTLRVFTNMRYMAAAQRATGIRFFDAKGQRRDAFAVLEDIRAKYQTLTTDKQRADFVQKAFGKTDLDTIKGLKTLLAGDNLDNVRQFSREIGEAGGTLKRDFSDATRNLFDQAGRLKNVLTEAAESFTVPLNKGITAAIKKLLDKKEDGGWDLSGKEIAAGGATALLAAYLGKRFGGPLAQKLLGRLGNTTAGIAEGKVIEAATGVTPVFVTNWPVGSGIPGSLPLPLPSKTAKNTWWDKAKKYAPLAMRFPLPPHLKIPVLAIGGAIIGTAALAEIFNRADKKNNESYADWVHDKVQNVINVSLNVDENRRITAKTDNMQTDLNVKRGKF